MSKPASMADDTEFFAAKGQGGPSPDAAASLPPTPPRPAPKPPAPPAAAPELPAYLAGPPPPQTRKQIGLRLDIEIYEDLLALSNKVRVPMQTLCSDAIRRFLEDVRAAPKKGRGG